MTSNRYHFLNIKNLANHSKDTVEFRAFSGSLNEVKIIGWIQLCNAEMFESVDKPAEDGSEPISHYLLGVKFHSLDWYTVYPQSEEDIEKIAALFGAR